MKKLLIVSSNTVHVYKFIELIREYFDQIVLICNEANGNYKGDVRVVDFSLKNPVSVVRTPSLIRKIIRDFKPSLIHVHQANSIAWYALRAAKGEGIPVVLTAWGSDILVLPKRSPLMQRMVRWNLQHADALTSDSEFMAGEMRRIAGEKIPEILIANFGIDLVPVNVEKETLVYSNRLHKKLYRIDAILRSFAEFSKTKSGGNWRLSVAATGEETGNLKSLSLALGIEDKVVFEGWVDKTKNAELYSRASVFVSIPESDATSISLLEAMASGCIPVVSDLPSNKEWIKDGVNGILVSDIAEDFISRALSLNHKKAAELNKDLIEAKATKAVNRRKFLALYDRLLNPSSTSHE